MSNLPINTTIASTFNKYFNDARNEDIEKCKDKDIKLARDKITYMAETINDNIKKSTDMVTNSSKLKALIIDYNQYIENIQRVSDWSSGHQKILKLTGKYSTMLSNLINQDSRLKKQCDEKMKQTPYSTLREILAYFSSLKQKKSQGHFYLPVYVLLKILRYQDLSLESAKHAEGLKHNVKLNKVLQVSGSQRRNETKLFERFFNFIMSNFNITINQYNLNQVINLSKNNFSSVDQFIEYMESLLIFFTNNDIPTSSKLSKLGFSSKEVQKYENIIKHIKFINTRAFALGEYFNLILISDSNRNKQPDHLKVTQFKQYINNIRKKLLGGIQTKYNTPSPPSSSNSNGVSAFENQFISEELPNQQRMFDEQLYDSNAERGSYVPKPTRRAPSKPKSYNPQRTTTDYSPVEARNAMGANAPLPPSMGIDLSSLDKYSKGERFVDRNRQVSTRSRQKSFNTGSERNTVRRRYGGGRKTRKNRHKNKNKSKGLNKNTKNKKKRNTKRNQLKFNKGNKRTRKNK